MANKAISELPQAQNVNNQDLFVLEQSGIAKKLPAETFITEQGIINALAEALDGHGGIQSVTLSSVSGRIRTYLITFTDGSATTFQVYDGTSIERISRTSSSGLDDVYTVFLSDGTTTFFTVHNGADGTVSEAMLNDALKDKAPAVTETTESSAIANFTDGADDLVMHNIVAEINPIQSGSGDPSPSNIRPISGWTGVNVTRAGKNLFNKTAVENNVYLNTTTGATSPAVGYVVSDYIPVFKGITVFIPSSATARRWFYDTNKVGKTYLSNSGNQAFTPTENGYIRVSIYISSVSIDTYQIELGSTATTYEPYIAPATASLSWQTEAGTVYGGTIDVATGLLTVTNGYIASYNGEALPSTWISDRDVYASGTTPTTGAEVVYKLATPQTYQLTGQQLKTLYGTNNVWTDTGNVSVTYTADTKLYIQNLTQPTEDNMTANQAITSGKFFMVGNNLYIATAAIASGAKIIEGTNATRLSLADALNRL